MAPKRKGGPDGAGNKRWPPMGPHLIYPEERQDLLTHSSALPRSPVSSRDNQFLSVVWSAVWLSQTPKPNTFRAHSKVIQQCPFLSQTINSSYTGPWVFHIRVLSTPGLAQSPCLKILIKWIHLFYNFFYNKRMPYFYLKSFFGFCFCNLTRPDLRT